MSAPKQKRSAMKVKKRRAGLFSKAKIININNVVVCETCSKPRLSHRYCCIT